VCSAGIRKLAYTLDHDSDDAVSMRQLADDANGVRDATIMQDDPVSRHDSAHLAPIFKR
jgi:hypothetical protein